MFSGKILKHGFLGGRGKRWRFFKDQLLTSVVLQRAFRRKSDSCRCQKEEGWYFQLFVQKLEVVNKWPIRDRSFEQSCKNGHADVKREDTKTKKLSHQNALWFPRISFFHTTILDLPSWNSSPLTMKISVCHHGNLYRWPLTVKISTCHHEHHYHS